MKEINTCTEIQSLSYELLKDFHDFCEVNGLRYILAGGTLLGAVRHQDFIPWDDDIDVQMPRPDYERFLELSKNGIGSNAKVICWKSMSKPYFAYAKLIDTRTLLVEDTSVPNEIGVFIDVFPTDGLPDDKKDIEKKFRRITRYKNLLNLRTLKIERGASFINYILKILTIPLARIVLNPKTLINKIDAIATEQGFDESENVAFQVLGYGIKEVTQRKDYVERIKLQFRDKTFYGPSNYDQYLKNLYGDYMQLPPKEKQVTHHGFKAYWRE